LIAEPNGDTMIGRTAEVDENRRGLGIGKSILKSAVDDAHSQGMNWGSDTKLSPAQTAVYSKLGAEGYNVQFHPQASVVEHDDGSQWLTAPQGQSAATIALPTAPDDASADDMPGWISRQAHAEGGEVSAGLDPIAKLVAKYGSDPIGNAAAHIADNGGITLHPGTGAQPTEGYAVSLHPGREAKIDHPPTPDDIKGYLAQHADAFAADPGAHFGAWENGGNHYLDVTHVDPDFSSAMQKARANNQMAIFDLANKQEIPNPDYEMQFLHMGNPTDQDIKLDPNMMGTGIKGAEARRGGPKVTSLYPADIDPAMIEPGLESKTPYRVTARQGDLYDINADPLNLRAENPDFSDFEQSIKDAGFHGYHVKDSDQPLFKGQARLFEPYPATQLPPIDFPGRQATPNVLHDQVSNVSQMSMPGQETPADIGVFPADAANKSTFKKSWSDRTKPIDMGGASTDDLLAKYRQPIIDDTMDTSDFAEGGEVGEALAPIEDMITKYASGAPNDHAAQLAQQVADKGTVTYNPNTGELPHEGYLVPTDVSRSVSMDSAPSADDIHNFMLQNQDALTGNDKAALHVEHDGQGNYMLHVAQVEPDFEGAQAAATANGAPGIREIHTGRNFPMETPPISEPPAESVRNLPSVITHAGDYSDRPSAAWTPGKPTVANPKRVAFPGIYDAPSTVLSRAEAQVGPEDPLLQDLFGVSRGDLSDIALARQGNELGTLPGAKANPQGAKSALGVMTPQNEQRLIDTLSAARTAAPELHRGMTGWYAMDPLYERFVQIFGEDEAPVKYAKFNTLMGMASPGSDVGTEVARGTSAHWLDEQGRFGDFRNYAGVPADERASVNAPADMAGIPGHPYHSTGQAGPMQDYLESGSMQMKSPKVPLYIHSSGTPETGFQTDTPVGDAHWARGVGLADTRDWRTSKGQQRVPGSSVSTPEMQTLAPWWRDRVAGPAGMQSVPAQALAWGAYGPATGVDTAIGAPKLEILSTQIGKLAQRLGVSPQTARDMVITGKAGAFADGGTVPGFAKGGSVSITQLKEKYVDDPAPDSEQGVIFIMRHGKTALDDLKRSDGWLDFPLSDEGRKALMRAQGDLKEKPIREIFTAPFKRTTETAELIQSGILHPCKVSIDTDLMTWNLGKLVGTPKKPNKPFVEYYMAHPHETPEGGESNDAFTARFTKAFGKVQDRAAKGEGPFLVVLSGSALRNLGEQLYGDKVALDLDEGGLGMVYKVGGKWAGKVIFGHKDEDDPWLS
jgi:broad specificity phosphatase PhoE